MPTIDINDFWTQTLAAIAAALFVLLIQGDWLRRPDRKAKPSTPTGGNGNHHGNQAILEGNEIDGDVRIDQRYEDNSRRTTIINNINHATGAAASSDDLGKGLLMVAAVVASAVLFVLFRPLLQAVSLGTAAAILLMLIVAIRRTHRLRAWTLRAVMTIVITVLAIVVVMSTWIGISALSRDGLTLHMVNAAIPQMTPEQTHAGIVGYFEYFFSTVLPAFFGIGPTVTQFVVPLFLAALAASALVVYAWLLLLDWHAFLGFNREANQKPKLVARAKSFNDGRARNALGLLVGAAIITVIAIGGAQGILYDLFQNQQAQLVSNLGTTDTSQ
ncbi:hypothetical protein C5E02_14630 [Rathayibacter rathayi]|uniref:hypothetical protein n=1 Tax=Rathayibacter rathayi TaxID=33887 RepID=UPI000CE827E9|nr:hypothetical protein [Rathayibacter rathayi]PPI57871.1 hypothetical protein C5E02_14630 [Rathayibacter rathayi]PPI66351.1 hypothetical protein C5E12_14360 [Rathayibacter rathayi]